MSHKWLIAGGVIFTAAFVTVAVLPPLTNPEGIKEHRASLGVPVNPTAGSNRGSMWKEMDKSIKESYKDLEKS